MSPNLFLALAGLLKGYVYIFNKQLALDKYHAATYTAVIQLVSGVLALPLLLYHFQIPRFPQYWLLAITSISIYGLGFFFSIKAYKLIDASVVGLIQRFKILIAALLGITLLAEIYTVKSYLGLFFVLTGALFIVFDQGKIKINSGIIYASVMTAAYGLAGVLDKVLLNHFSPYTYVFINSTLMGSLFFLHPKARKETPLLLKTKTKLVFLSAGLSVISWLMVLIVLQHGSVSTVYPIYDSLALIATVMAGIIILKETTQLYQKILGTISIIIGIFLLG
jgi:drug/metabolite transporter (DMT)-like permease